MGIEIHPCSRIGHWFREEAERPYDVKVRSVVLNYKRLAEVWFDDYLPLFYKVKPEAKRMKIGDLTSMKSVRDRLECKSMDWYVQNVDVELKWESKRICIPGAGKSQGGCDTSQAAPGKSTTDKVLSPQEFKQLRAALGSGFKFPQEEL